MTQKRAPAFTIVSGSLFLFFILATIAFIWSVFASSNMAYIWILAGVVASLFIATLVMAILSKRDRLKAVMIPIIVLSVIVANVNVFFAAIGLLREGVQESRERDYQTAISLATLDKAMEQVPSTFMPLRTPKTRDSRFSFYDDDGSIVAKLKAIEFTHEGSNSYDAVRIPEHENSYSIDLHETAIVFEGDFSGLDVFAIYSRGFLSGGPVVGVNHYSMDAGDGAALKKMIDDKISSQKEAYEAKEAEALAGATFEAILDYFSGDDKQMLLTYYGDPDESKEVTNAVDGEKKVVQALKDFDASGFKKAESGQWQGKRGFWYKVDGEGCWIRYSDEGRSLSVEKRYADPFKHDRVVNMYYELTPADERTLLETISGIAGELAQENPPDSQQ